MNWPLLSPLGIYLRGYRVSSTSDAKLAYNELTYTTLQKYSSLLSRLVAMSMRMLDAFFSAPQTATLLLQGTSKQISASFHLYSAILRQQPTFDYPVILDRLHTFLVSLAKPGELSTDRVACPTDQLLYLVDFQRGHICQRKSAICSDCAALRFCIKSILFHVARLAHDNISSFQWFQQLDITNAASGIYDSEEVAVVGILLFGSQTNRVDSDLPLWGIFPETVARAIHIVSSCQHNGLTSRN